MTGAFLLGLVVGAGLTWVFMRRRDGCWREFNARHPGRNLPPPDLLPMPPATGAQRIYRGAMWREKGSDVWHPIGVPWEEGPTQRGNGNGGPSTPKPPIKPQPSGSTPNPPPEAP